MSGAPRADVLAALRARLSAPASDPAELALATLEGLPLTPHELGELYADLRAAQAREGAPQAQRVVATIQAACAGAGVQPRFSSAAAQRAFACDVMRHPSEAMAVLAGFDGEPTDAMRARAAQLLRQCCRGVAALAHLGHPAPLPVAPAEPYGLHVLDLATLALARLASEPWLGDVQALLRSGATRAHWVCAEREALAQVALPSLACLAAELGWFQAGRVEARPDPAVALADEPAYMVHARACLEAAAARLDELHAGRLPYVADRVFDLDDTPVLSRAARVAAMRDEPWFRPLIGPLLTRCVVAPTAARTAPSQSLAVALGHVVEAYPTPEGVQALRDALSMVRHAGLEKKLERHLKPAQRGVAARAEVALRLLPGAQADARIQSSVAICLEATFWQGGSWSLPDWRAQLADTPNGAPFAFAQMWRVQPAGGAPVTLRAERDGPSGLRLVDAQGNAVRVGDDARVSLWHPLQATSAERAAWQRACANWRLRQPLRQAFREIYPLRGEDAARMESAEFAGHHLRLETLLGLARREGWTPGDHTLTRRFGPVRAIFGVGANLYPGVTGNAPSLDLAFQRRDGRRWRWLPLGEVDPIVYSEACRAVDLLVSVSAFALEDHPDHLQPNPCDLGAHPGQARRARVDALAREPLGEMAAMRRQALGLALAEPVAAGRVVVESRHVRVGDATVHLATGRAMEHGAPLALAPLPAKARLAAVPWLPYDEVLLQRIVDNVAALLARA